MTSSMIAWHRTMHTPLTTSTEHRAHSLSQRRFVFIRTHMHRGSSSNSLRHSHHLHVHGHPCVLFILILPFYFLLYLPPLFLFLKYLKSVVNLHNSCNESMDSTDEFSLSTVPRVKLFVPQEETFPVPMKYIDVTRTTKTSLDVMLEKILKITGTWMEEENDRIHGQASKDSSY